MSKKFENWKNQLYFADNLEVLKRLYKDYPKGLIDLCYIDPPFNSNRNYSVLFETIDMTDTKAQKEAFADTWSNFSYLDTLHELQDLNLDVYNYLDCLEKLPIKNGASSYLTTMAIRIYYIHKVLKDTGSFYLHCDPTMSHYLKIICDLIFKEKNFRNEIIWSYYRWANVQKQLQSQHDIILFYSKTENNYFNVLKIPLDKNRKRNLVEMIDGKKVCKRDENGDIIYREQTDKPLSDVWEIFRVGNTAKERLNYPTQKPELLLERIINASSNKCDIVADFFCGCGTTVAVAQKLNRRWIGVDISHLAVNLIEKKRLIEPYKNKLSGTYEIHGFPKDLDSAKELAKNVKGGRLQFEQWIVEVMLNGVLNDKKNELGFDGYFTFYIKENEKHHGFIEVKSGHTDVHDVNHFIATVNDKKAHFGIFVCFDEQITKEMLRTSKKQGIYGNFNYDRIQIISVENLLNGNMPKIPESTDTTFKKSKRKIITNINSQGTLDL